MSGTIIISSNKSFDVRTIDFIHIIDSLRTHMAPSEISRKIFETYDECGMNMICADELNSEEFTTFGNSMKELLGNINDENAGLKTFIEMVCSSIVSDERFI